MATQSGAKEKEVEWTLILWDIENVAVPEQLRDATGIKQLTQLLKEEFANKLGKELYSIKLACHWSHHRSPYADLLGSLTTLGDVEALSYQWQGHADKVHNADRMLKRAADRFMRLMEKKGPTAPQHLVVFITSDEDFSEQIAQLQSRNFQVAVLYHYPSASKKAAAIGHAANISHDWLPFLTSGLNNPHLTLTYDPNLYYPAGPGQPNQGRRQNFAGSPQQAAAFAQGSKFGQLPAAQVQSSTWAADPVSSSSCVAVYGLQEGKPPIAKRVALLLAQHAGQQVADSANITVLLDSRGSFAVLDFSTAPEPIKKAANAVSALDGQFWGDSQLKVQLYADKGAALTTCSSNQPILHRPAVQSVPSNGRVANGSCSIGIIEPSSNVYKSNGYKSNVNGYRCNSADHCINGNGYKATPGRLQGGNGNVTMPNRGQAGSTCPSSYGYQGGSHGSPMDRAIAKADCSNSGSKQVAICSSEPAAKGKVDSKASQPQSGVAWGFISALDGTCEAFSPDDSVMLEHQWNKLQSAEADTKAASEHRYYILTLGNEVCTIDLVAMLLSSENGGKAPCPAVYRDAAM